MSTLQTLDRGLRALELISLAPEGVMVADLARELGVHRAVCYRIVATLESHQLVTRGGDGRIRLASGIAVLASRFEPQVTRELQVLLRSLANEAHATAFVSAPEGDDCVVLMTAEPDDTMLTVGYRVGGRHPLSKGAAGIAILAARPESDTDPEPVRQARRDGYSLTRGQLQPGAVGVAVGVRIPPAHGAGLGIERCIGVVALDSLDTDLAIKAVQKAARQFEQLLTG
ncbi:MAG TPA: helix-turn-helix domain-containing protein [Pseudonocardiaceae bacterium]